jgi:hypothetical protein
MFGVKIADDEKCECCNKSFTGSFITGKGLLVCDVCVDDFILCDCCGEYRTEEEYSFNQENCDACCERKADMLGD